eukprot:TRINITY_DN25475_c0_g1_i1.p1 TRINITY_DN25475_c0_g1~~TRINITY_DN25475_c0_g1_i1.p1  ORF type:complete len:1381 (-),score=255.55 TRINITY_DN25475_c0_g1_i1:78-4220(-)
MAAATEGGEDLPGDVKDECSKEPVPAEGASSSAASCSDPHLAAPGQLPAQIMQESECGTPRSSVEGEMASEQLGPARADEMVNGLLMSLDLRNRRGARRLSEVVGELEGQLRWTREAASSSSPGAGGREDDPDRGDSGGGHSDAGGRSGYHAVHDEEPQTMTMRQLHAQCSQNSSLGADRAAASSSAASSPAASGLKKRRFRTGSVSELQVDCSKQGDIPESSPGPPSSSPPTPRSAVGEVSFSALKRSALGLHLPRVVELVSHGVSVNMPLREEREGTIEFSTLLHAVCDLPVTPAGQPQEDSVEVVEALLDGNANIDPRSSRGCTPLMNACRHKNIEMAKLLLGSSASVTSCDDSGHTCLTWAITLQEDKKMVPAQELRKPWPEDESRSAELLELLLSVAAEEIHQRSPKTGQHRFVSLSTISEKAEMDQDEDALARKDTEQAALGEVLRHQDASAVPPLLHAVKQQNTLAALVMLERGAPPVWLHEAVTVGSVDLVEALLQSKADPSDEDLNGENAIDIAMQLGSDNRIIELLRRKARPSKQFDDLAPEVVPRNRSFGQPRLASGAGAPANLSLFGMVGEVQPGGSPKHRLRQALRGPSAWLSQRCRWLFSLHIFQAFTFCMLLCGLYLPDLWTLSNVRGDAVLDATLYVVIASFTIELFAQAVGFPDTYLFTFFFFMDVIGALSLVLELSYIKAHLDSSPVGQQAVVARASRAAKFGARAGRITRLVKLLRFIQPADALKHVGTAKTLSAKLVTRVSTVVSCIIILLGQVLPVTNAVTFPTQDWSMQLWTSHLWSTCQEESPDSSKFQEAVRNFRDFYARQGTRYFPYSVKIDGNVVWRTRGPLREEGIVRVEQGTIEVLFDFTAPNQIEAAMDMSIITGTLLLMVVFSLVISSKVSHLALNPLETMLAKVREIGILIFKQAESITFGVKKKKDSITQPLDVIINIKDETLLLQEVVSKITALSAIKLQEACNSEGLPYIGEGSTNRDDVRRLRSKDPHHVRRNLTLEKLEAENLYSWRFNPLQLKEGQGQLVCATLLAMVLPSSVTNVAATGLLHFVDEISTRYLAGPQYHNWLHAVDVTHSTFVILRELGSKRSLISSLELYALMVSAVAHDVGHPGLSNDFLISTGNDLAIRYNDISPLENMHSAILFEVLSSHESNVFGDMKKEKSVHARRVCIEAILHTDNALHFTLVKTCQLFCDVHSELLQRVRSTYTPSSSSNDDNAWPPKILTETLEHHHRDQLRNSVLHLADISDMLKPFDVCCMWADRMLEEFFAQGDKMKELGIPVPALSDRAKTHRSQYQFGVIEFIVAPLLTNLTKILPPLQFIEQGMLENAGSWFEDWNSNTYPLESEFQSMLARLKRLQEKSNYSAIFSG